MYMYTAPIPKPPLKKKSRKKQNGYKDKPNRYCYYCHTARAERHEVYGGNPNRQTSIDHGFQVDLCCSCHEEMTRNITQRGKERNQYWREHYQRLYESKLIESGIKQAQARHLWMSLIGKNYLDLMEE